MTDKIQTIKLITPEGRVFGLNQDAGDLIILAKAMGFTGENFNLARIDPSTLALESINIAHHKIHYGDSYCCHHYEEDFDKASEIGILFTTPNTTKFIHAIALVYCGAAALFEILEAPTVDTGNYPVTFPTPNNRNRNSSNTSGVLSVRAVPVANQASLKNKADAAPVTADGTVIHAECIGSGKQGGGSGNRDSDEFVLRRNTTYYFRLKGTANGADNSVAAVCIIWYEHTDLE